MGPNVDTSDLDLGLAVHPHALGRVAGCLDGPARFKGERRSTRTSTRLVFGTTVASTSIDTCCRHPPTTRPCWPRVPAADLPTMLRVVAHLRARDGIREVMLAGLQPRLDDRAAVVCPRAPLGGDRQGVDDQPRTQAGRLAAPAAPGRAGCARAQRAGLSPQPTYQQVMGLDALDNALAVVELARRLGLPVAVNQVVLRGHHQVIPAFLDWLREHELWLRLYDLVWNPAMTRSPALPHLLAGADPAVGSGHRAERITVVDPWQ